eukprot:TRINITY_DN9644_c0_g1_i2.p1 TRINITY_DN9644_c0_g1~~TRINITY_DN9644_c0_g1_i2.p1  ORF type:complete len:320 (-),score=47.15 TRINITY_DN9644_c0_g1_i2:213-1172(-)
MGLCKCPKRKVTNQFCFEHRVNVCEHCMVSNHKKCVVQSYLAWLQDSDYNPDCAFCNSPLSEEECIRLTCYCLYHWNCLDNHCRNLPPTTTPEGYTCVQCDAPIFPAENLVSPVADQLRKCLQDVNWARAGLGLPLIDASKERKIVPVVPMGPRPTPEGQDKSGDPMNLAHELIAAKKSGRSSSGSGAGSSGQTNTNAAWKSSSGDTVLEFDTPASRRLGSEFSDLASSPLIAGSDPDSGANKYKRRAPTDLIFRWLRSVMKASPRGRRGFGSWPMMVILAVIGILTLFAILSYLSRGGDYDDPMLDPMNNPNIRVEGI